MKFFLWIFHHVRLPCSYTLNRIGLSVDERCRHCNHVKEEVNHILGIVPRLVTCGTVSQISMVIPSILILTPFTLVIGHQFGISYKIITLTMLFPLILRLFFVYGTFKNADMIIYFNNNDVFPFFDSDYGEFVEYTYLSNPTL